MRYFRIEWLDKANTPGFMEVTDEGNMTRLVDLKGNEFKEPYPDQSYRTLDKTEATKPDWGV